MGRGDGKMTTSTKSRIMRDVQVFKATNLNQRKQYMADRLKHIKNMTADYNNDLLDGEIPITVQEMADQLSRKADV